MMCYTITDRRGGDRPIPANEGRDPVMNINKVIVSGNLTRDPELRASAGGTQVVRFGVAVNDRVRDQQTGEWRDHANFVDCVAFGNHGEALSKILRKGSKVTVEGKLHFSSWQGQDGSKRSRLEVFVDHVDLMSRAQQTVAGDEQPLSADQLVSDYGAVEVADEDIPF